MDGTTTAVTSVPIESLIRDMKRGRSYTLGLASAFPCTERIPYDWVNAIARKCIEKTDRDAVLIRTQDVTATPQAPTEDANCDRTIKCVQWTPWREPLNVQSPAGRIIRSELATLPLWRQQFSLVVLELGDLSGHSFSGMGKLCDGIALVARPNSTRTIHGLARALRRHQADGIRVIGLWQMGLLG